MMERLDSGWARAVSLTAALALMLLITLVPRGLTGADGTALPHGLLALVMWGMSAGFVHGVGYVPKTTLLRLPLGALAAWPLLALGLGLYIAHFAR